MQTVGIRELKNRLSEYLRRVAAGESVLVTDRGTVIAEISAPGQRVLEPSVPAGLALLARRGLVTLGSGGDGSTYRQLPRRRRNGHSAAQLLDDERGPR